MIGEEIKDQKHNNLIVKYTMNRTFYHNRDLTKSTNLITIHKIQDKYLNKEV